MIQTLQQAEQAVAGAMASGDWGQVERLAPVLEALAPRPGTPTLVGAALWYAEAGLRVFPLQPQGKKPYPGSRGCTEATSDPEQIIAWWRDKPVANLGLATGYGIDVIDFDGALGHAAWRQAFNDPAHPWGEGTRVLATVSTPRPGGLHAYVPATGEGNRAAMAPGVDYRGRGGYVVAPPSTTPQGAYRFLRKLNPEDI